MKLLLTAFDPFGGEPVNPALEAVKKVQNQIGSVSIVKLEVPTVFGTSIQTVAKAIEQEMPDAVLCIGQAGGRYGLTPERVAINLDDARIKDNEGNQPIDLPIYPSGRTSRQRIEYCRNLCMQSSDVWRPLYSGTEIPRSKRRFYARSLYPQPDRQPSGSRPFHEHRRYCCRDRSRNQSYRRT